LSLTLRLFKAGVIEWVVDPKNNKKFLLLIHDYAPYETKSVKEYLELANIPFPKDVSQHIAIPFYFSQGEKRSHSIGFITRSTGEMIDILSACTEIPKGDTAISFPPIGLPGKDIQIRSSSKKPENASLAVKYRNHWF
jgi:hypothetical protein